MIEDNFIKADNLLYEIYTLLCNDDVPLSERDAWFSKEIMKLGTNLLERYTDQEMLNGYYNV